MFYNKISRYLFFFFLYLLHAIRKHPLKLLRFFTARLYMMWKYAYYTICYLQLQNMTWETKYHHMVMFIVMAYYC